MLESWHLICQLHLTIYVLQHSWKSLKLPELLEYHFNGSSHTYLTARKMFCGITDDQNRNQNQNQQVRTLGSHHTIGAGENLGFSHYDWSR